MPARVTRAAARADPALADETQTFIDAATPHTSVRNSKRRPLKETTGNDTAEPDSASSSSEEVQCEKADLALVSKKNEKDTTQRTRRMQDRYAKTPGSPVKKNHRGKGTSKGDARPVNLDDVEDFADDKNSEKPSENARTGGEQGRDTAGPQQPRASSFEAFLEDDEFKEAFEAELMLPHQALLRGSRIPFVIRPERQPNREFTYGGSPTTTHDFGGNRSLIISTGGNARHSAYYYTGGPQGHGGFATSVDLGTPINAGLFPATQITEPTKPFEARVISDASLKHTSVQDESQASSKTGTVRRPKGATRARTQKNRAGTCRGSSPVQGDTSDPRAEDYASGNGPDDRQRAQPVKRTNASNNDATTAWNNEVGPKSHATDGQTDEAERTSEAEKKSESIQKLCSLFEPPSREEQVEITSPLALSRASHVELLDTNDAAASPGELKTEIRSKTQLRTTPSTKTTEAGKNLASQKENKKTLLQTASKIMAPVQAVGHRASTVAQKSSKLDVADKLKKRSEIAALNTPPRLNKSAKPATVPSFQLPGDAVAAKHKAAKEEREKRREEEYKKKKGASKKPIGIIRPISKAPQSGFLAPKTPTVKAPRPSVVGIATMKSRPLDRPSIKSRPSVSPAKSPLKEATPSNINAASRTVRTSPSAAKVNTAKPATVKYSRPSMFTAPTATEHIKRNWTANTARARITSDGSSASNKSPTSKGKEAYSRDKIAKEQPEKANKDKLEAAKAAKERAAQQGRAAAAQWAEKNRQVNKRVVPETSVSVA